jgi:hypothetical protein
MLSGVAAMARKGAALMNTTGRARTLKGLNGSEAPRDMDEAVAVKAREAMKTPAGQGLSYEQAYAKTLQANPQHAAAAIWPNRFPTLH